MLKFKIGDRVVGNSNASSRYAITISGWRGTVTNIHRDGYITLDDTYTVEQDYFDLVSDKNK